MSYQPTWLFVPNPRTCKVGGLGCQDRLIESFHNLSENRLLDPILTGFWLLS
jgi:hypothetical protein